MSQELIDRLRRLGVTKGARNLKPASKPAAPPRANRRLASRSPGAVTLERQFPGGQLQESEHGACFVVDNVYDLDHLHGRSRLAALLRQEPEVAARYCRDDRLVGLNFRDFVFLDTETTGLHGANTIAFLVGIAFFDDSEGSDALVVRQYFLRDHDDEIAMLQSLESFLMNRSGLITFNGRTFDLPLLNNRYLMNRLPSELLDIPHIDLLPLARRLWRLRIGSVALGNLENEVLEVRRTEADVPGWLIPAMYTNYLRSQDAREMRRVFYHNEIDMLSMVTLTDYVCRLIGQSGIEADPIDNFSLGKWQADMGLLPEAETTLGQVVSADLPLPIYHKALERLALLFKRQRRYNDALPLWQQWAATSENTVDAHIELAKYYEWQEKDIETAERWTRAALSLVESWSYSHGSLIRPDLEHRLSRLRRKLTT